MMAVATAMLDNSQMIDDIASYLVARSKPGRYDDVIRADGLDDGSIFTTASRGRSGSLGFALKST